MWFENVVKINTYLSFSLVKPKRDCKQHKWDGEGRDGIYLIDPASYHPFSVYCDMNTDGGGKSVTSKEKNFFLF